MQKNQLNEYEVIPDCLVLVTGLPSPFLRTVALPYMLTPMAHQVVARLC